MADGESGYKACLVDNLLDDGGYPSTKSFKFKIVKCQADWIAVGICYKKIV